MGGGGHPKFGASRSEGDLDADGNERAWRYLLSRGESVGSDAGGARSLGLSRNFSAVLLFEGIKMQLDCSCVVDFQVALCCGAGRAAK